MAKQEMVIKTQYRIVFFPFATYTRCGDIEQLTILGWQAYGRVGNVRQYAGLIVRKDSQDAT